jgi:hypothetical protein
VAILLPTAFHAVQDHTLLKVVLPHAPLVALASMLLLMDPPVALIVWWENTREVQVSKNVMSAKLVSTHQTKALLHARHAPLVPMQVMLHLSIALNVHLVGIRDRRDSLLVMIVSQERGHPLLASVHVAVAPMGTGVRLAPRPVILPLAIISYFPQME